MRSAGEGSVDKTGSYNLNSKSPFFANADRRRPEIQESKSSSATTPLEQSNYGGPKEEHASMRCK